jgi:hypothetical protein
VYKDRSLSKSLLKSFKHALGVSIKINNIASYFSNKLSKRGNYFRKPKNKPLVEVSKSNKGLYVLNNSKVLLAYNSLNFI